MIPAHVYSDRRHALVDALDVTHGIVIFPGQTTQYRNGDTEQRFRQNSTFLYYTGFTEPDAVCALVIDRGQFNAILFHRGYCAKAAQWGEPGIDHHTIINEWGFDRALPIGDFSDWMMAQQSQYPHVYCYPPHGGLTAMPWLNNAGALDSPKLRSQSALLANLVHQQRACKSPEEIFCIQRAVDISIQAHQDLQSHLHPGVSEAELDGLLLACFRRHQAWEAYPNIVASGANACRLHYTAHHSTCQANDYVLVDAGAEWGGYAGDLTRVYPVNGEFSADIAALYQRLITAQEAVIAAVQPGVSLIDLQRITVALLVDILIDFDILHGDKEQLIEQKAYLPFYCHSVGHSLGLDVHDPGLISRDGTRTSAAALQSSMVITIEPGLYFPPDVACPAPFCGLGLRIEDDILVGDDGPISLSAALAKFPHDRKS